MQAFEDLLLLPVYGIDSLSRYDCISPSSPPLPCKTINTLSGDIFFIFSILFLSKSNSNASTPEDINELYTLFPDIRDISLSFDQPPIITRTFPYVFIIV